MNLQKAAIDACGFKPELLDHVKSCWEKRESVNSGVHAKLIDLFKLYLVVGGMPTTDKAAYRIGEKVHVRVPVKNTGKVAGREVVQLYVRDEVASILPRERELKEFTSVWLKPGEEKTVEFTLDDNAFALYDKDLKRIVEPGAFTLYVGPDSTTMNAVRISFD